MKTIISKDGRKKAILQVKVPIGIEELTIIAAHVMGQKKKGRASKKDIEEELRYRLRTAGTMGIYKLEEVLSGLDKDNWQQLKARAEDLVAGLYPEFQAVPEKT